MKTLWEEFCKYMGSIGADPAIGIAICVMIILLLIILISDGRKHRKMIRLAKENSQNIDMKLDYLVQKIGEEKEKEKDKGPGVIYIDNRQVKEVTEKAQEIVDKVNEDLGYENLMKDLVQMQKGEIEVTPMGKRSMYTDRETGISKNGTEYTLEQLDKQIRD